MTNAAHTPGPLYVGAQNDELYITAGRAPAKNNDHPWHDAPRVAIAKVFGPNEEANAARIVACVNACEGINPDAVPDLFAALGDLIAEYTAAVDPYRSGGFYSNPDDDWPILDARAAIAKARSQ